MELLNTLLQFVVVPVVGYLIFSHRRTDRLERKVDIHEVLLDTVKEDIREIKRLLEKLADNK